MGILAGVLEYMIVIEVSGEGGWGRAGWVLFLFRVSEG